MVRKQPKRTPRPGVDEYGRTPLHNAVIDRDFARARELILAGAAVAAADDEGWTPLHFAAQASSVDLARLLLDHQAPIDPQDVAGNTPLFKATFSSRGDGSVVALLRARGADPWLANGSGVSPVALARTIANYDVRRFYADLPESLPTKR